MPLANELINMLRYVSRHVTCKLLSIPSTLACIKYKPSLERIYQGQYVRSKFKPCQQPWGIRWALYRELGFVKKYQDIQDHLGKDCNYEDADILIPTHVYAIDKTLKITQSKDTDSET